LGGGARAWRTPIRLRSLDPGPTAGLVVDARGSVQAPVAPPLLANAGQAAYARTAYDGAAFDAVLARFGTLGPTDQFAVLMDAYAMGVAGVEPLSQYLRLLGALPAGADPAVWAQPTDTLAELDTGYAPGPQRAAFRAWAAGVLRPVRLRLGFDARAGEADNDAVLRRRLLPTLGRLQDAAVLAEARRRFAANGSDPARLDPAERPWVQAVIARAATPREFEALLAAGKRETDPLRQQRLFADLARVEDPALAERFLEVLLTEAAPAHQAPRLVLGVAAGHPDLAWTFALAHMPQLTPGMDALTRTTFAPAVASASSDLERANELANYAARRIPADAQGEVRTALARIRARADLRARSLPQIDAWIAAR